MTALDADCISGWKRRISEARGRLGELASLSAGRPLTDEERAEKDGLERRVQQTVVGYLMARWRD